MDPGAGCRRRGGGGATAPLGGGGGGGGGGGDAVGRPLLLPPSGARRGTPVIATTERDREKGSEGGVGGRPRRRSHAHDVGDDNARQLGEGCRDAMQTSKRVGG